LTQSSGVAVLHGHHRRRTGHPLRLRSAGYARAAVALSRAYPRLPTARLRIRGIADTDTDTDTGTDTRLKVSSR
jgi:hypothetical protein